VKKHPKLFASVALSIGLALALGGVAAAKGGGNEGHGNSNNGHGHGHDHGGVVATGTTTCRLHGRVIVGANGAVSITGNITPMRGPACSSNGGAKIRTGHFTSPLTSSTTPTTTTTTSTTTTVPGTTTTSTTSTTTTTTTTSTTTTTLVTPTSTTTTLASCQLLPAGALPDLAGGTIAWSPRPKSAPSVGIAVTGGSVSTVTIDGKQYLQITYTAGSVASGSFMTSSGVSLSLTSNQTLAELGSACVDGAHSIGVHGTLTL
jgi:hypothetical protein